MTKNHLSSEQSPYLLQHKDNPVHWYAFNDDAFKAAAEQDKPIFLSIGYSTCHWCHVMERESFEDSEVASLMNESFVNIKVDREERPDIDHLYMTVCQMMTGQGGWPLTVIMTPDKRPFFAGTYFPKHSRGQQPGMLDLISYIAQIWKDDRDKALESANQIVVQLIQQNRNNVIGNIDRQTLDKAFKQIESSYDLTYKGFGSAPKFPTPHKFNFLLGYYDLTKKKSALDMTTDTLKVLRQKGIYDQVGHGFHRYSTDEQWILPHFEKMLYDQAQLMIAYAQAYKVTHDSFYKQVVHDISDYVLTTLHHKDGGFYSAEDADSEGEEGKFYIWSLNELRSFLFEDEISFLTQTFNVAENGNFKDESTGKQIEHNILYVSKDLSKQEQDQWAYIQKKLYTERSKRIRPSLDDKILTDWNGLMIAAYAEAGYLLSDQQFTQIAIDSIKFIEMNLMTNNQLYHRFRNNHKGIKATAYDYVYLLYAYLNCYKATQDEHYLFQAKAVFQEAKNKFWDQTSAGFFNSDNDDIIVKQKDSYDGALPSINGLLYHVLLQLSQLLHDPDLFQVAMSVQHTFASTVNGYPMVYTSWLSAQLLFETGLSTCVIVGKISAEDLAEIKHHLPLLSIIQHIDLNTQPILAETLNQKGFKQIDQKTTYYFCQNFSCQQPVTTLKEFLTLLEKNTELNSSI